MKVTKVQVLYFCSLLTAFGTSIALATPPKLEMVFRRNGDVQNYPNAVPGCPGEVISSGAQEIDNPAVDNNGNVIFRAILDTSGAFGNTATTANRMIILYGGPPNSANPLHLIARDGVGNLHLPNVNNWSHGGTYYGLRSMPMVSPGGTLFISSSLVGTGATPTNSTACWTGPDGNLTEVVQRGFLPSPGGIAPGTAGAQWGSDLNFDTSQYEVNDAGQVTFWSTLVGGDTDQTNNNAVFIGSHAGVSLVARKGMTNVAGLDDPTIAIGDTPQWGIFENHFGEVAFIGWLQLYSGSFPVSLNDDSAIFTTLGGTLHVIARENDPVPWDNTLTWAVQPYTNASNFGQLGQPMSSNHTYFLESYLGGSATPGANDYVLCKYHWDTAKNTGTWTPLVRRGDPCPLVPGAQWGIFNNNNTRCNAVDGVSFTSMLQDDGSGTINSNNDEAIFYMPNGGAPQLVIREGVPLYNFGSVANLPGIPDDGTLTPGTLSIFSGGQPLVNSRGQMVFQEQINGSGIVHPDDHNPSAVTNDRVLFAWDPNEGLMVLAQTGQVYDPAMGWAAGVDLNSPRTGEATSTSLSETGWVAFRVRDTYGNWAVMRAQLSHCGSADFNHDGDIATDADIEAFFACLAGNCCPTCDSSDFNGDGDYATDADIEAFFRVLAGGSC
jgi:hypothetical protein